MKVSSVCYATEQGLGVLAKAFYDHGVITDPAIIRHSSRPNHIDWYKPGTPLLNNRDRDFPSDASRHVLTPRGSQADAILFFETPFRWELIRDARRLGIPTALMVMYECAPDTFPAGCHPDVILTPSSLDQDHFPTGVRCTVPAPDDVPGVVRDRPITTFVHNAGHGGLRGRNGTAELLQAWPMVNPKATLLVRSQEVLSASVLSPVLACDNVELSYGTVPRNKLYSRGECFVFPEKFNGLSLPLQEAYSAGMVVCSTARKPNTDWLPPDPLIPVKGYRPARVAPRFKEFQEAVVNPEDIAATLNRLYGKPAAWLSNEGVAWGRANSWAALGPWYKQLLARVAKGVFK